MKPFSEACERNRGPILGLLEKYFLKRSLVLEIGSGTGQHAAYFAPALPHLVWQPSDVVEHHGGIRAWTQGIPNVMAPLALDVDDSWPEIEADAVFTANTCHIMSWRQVGKMFEGIGRLRSVKAICIYGPFNYGGRPTSDSNARFDALLRARDPASGLRDLESMAALGKAQGFFLDEDNAMPANNRLLYFMKN